MEKPTKNIQLLIPDDSGSMGDSYHHFQKHIQQNKTKIINEILNRAAHCTGRKKPQQNCCQRQHPKCY